MKKRFITWGLVFIGILLLMTGALFGNMVVEKLSDSYGLYSTGKVVVNVAKEAAADRNNLFTVKDVEKLSQQPGTGELAAAAESSMPVKYGNSIVASVIRGVSSNYGYFLALDIVKGNFLSRADEEEASQVAVIDEELALELFKTNNAVGNGIEVYGRKFKIIGVAARDPSLLGALTAQKEPSVYIPVNVMLDLDKEAGISSIQVKTTEDDLLGRNVDIVSNALRAIGRNPSGYIIEDYGIKAFFLRQKTQLAVFVPGLVLILLLAVLLKNSIKRLVLLLASGCKADYLINVLKIHRTRLLSELTRSLLLLGGMLAVWFGISFKLFIPQSYIPDELIDLSYYAGLWKDIILQGNSRIGYLPTVEEILLMKAQNVIDWMFYLSLTAGIPMVLIGLYQLKLRGASLSVLAPACGIMTVAAIALVFLAAMAAGMPLSSDTGGLLVLFAFVFINSILFSKEREEVF